MTIADEFPAQDHAFYITCKSFRDAFDAHVIRPMIARLLDDCYARGDLPLPPLGWPRAEPWYVGDLR